MNLRTTLVTGRTFSKSAIMKSAIIKPDTWWEMWVGGNGRRRGLQAGRGL